MTTEVNGNFIDGEPFLQLGSDILKFEITDLSESDQQAAKEELRETPEQVIESLEEFRKLIQNEKGLNYPLDDDSKLQTFLRPCKYYPNSALDRMKKYYRFKVKYPKYSQNLFPTVEKNAFMQNLVTVLPGRTKKGERILVVEPGKKWDTKTCSLNDILRAVMMILEAAVGEPKTQVFGVHVILDMAGLSLNHVWQFTPSFASNVVEWVQDCIPIRLKGVHIVNQPYIFNMVFALFKPFFREKLQKRIIFHGTNFNNLHKLVSPSALPAQFKGTADVPMDQGKRLHEYLMNFEASFKEKYHYGYSSIKDCES